MDETERRQQLQQALAKASAAHFEYETNTLQGVYDQQWAEWYAEFMLAHGWNDMCAQEWNVAALAATLRQLDQEYRAQAPQNSWQEFYAARFAA